MKDVYSHVLRPEMCIIGLSVRTTNEDGKSRYDIAALWDQFMKEKMVEKIPNKKTDDIIFIYTEYEGDFMKPYTCIIGCEVTSLGNVPQGMIGIKCPAFQSALFSYKDDSIETVGKAWQQIWSMPLDRAYTHDLQIHKNVNSSASLQIFIALK